MNSLCQVSLSLFVLLAVVFGVAGEVPPAPSDTAQILEGIRKKRFLPALAVIVMKDGKICDRAAVGVRKSGDPTPVTVDDQWHIGSCTKSMTATLTAMLIEDGTLRWDTTVADVFPELKGKINKVYETVTVEQLLTHRAGFATRPPADALKQAWEESGPVREQRYEFIKAVLRQPPAAPPGTRHIYSNQSYALIGAMLERLTGKSWEALMNERLFQPLEMKSAGFGTPGTIGKVDQPWGHFYEGGKITPTQLDNPLAIGPAGRVHGTLDDFARYAMLHLQRGKGASLLKPETLRRLHTPPAGEDYACGWIVVDRTWAGGKALTHAGTNTFWYFDFWLAPEKDFVVIVATNVGGNDAGKGCDEAASAMIGKWLKP